MQIGFLTAASVPVPDAIVKADVNGNILAVQGAFYSGTKVPDGHLVVWPKQGWFDGMGMFAVQMQDRKTAIRLHDSTLPDRLFGSLPTAVGEFLFKYDCIAIGSVIPDPQREYGALLVSLQLLLFQTWRDFSNDQTLYMVTFPAHRLPALPWTSELDAFGEPLLAMEPLPPE